MLYLDVSSHPYTLFYKRRKICLNFFETMFKLARILICDKCANLLNYIRKIIFSQEFLENNRYTKSDFTRTRLFPFTSLVLYLCNFTKSSYQTELNKFFKIITGASIAKHIVSKVAFCNARKKLKHEAFIELNEQASQYFYHNFQPLTWQGFSLKAVDGSTIKLPNFPEIAEHFGTWNPRQGEPVPMARISQMFDPLNRITTHALLSPKSIGEREMAATLFEHLGEQDLVLLDRGYPAFWLFKLILSYKAHFCSRISSSKWKIVRDFVRSGSTEQVVLVEAPLTSQQACLDRNLGTDPITLRFIRVELDSGEGEVLVTSLLDYQRYSSDIFKELYHSRWPVEEDYKIMKCRIELENFSGQTQHSVYQDFHARVFSKNVTSMLVFVAQHKVTKETEHRECLYKVNYTQALSTLRDTIVLFFQRSKSTIYTLVSDVLETMSMAIELVRPGRQYPRNHKRAQRKYCLNYKPVL